MPAPPETPFNRNTTGFAHHAPVSDYSLLPNSPFRSDGEAFNGGAKEIQQDPTTPNMGFVLGPQQYRKRDNKPKPRTKFRIRIACEHWAPAEGDDCRFGCEARAQQRAFTP